MAQAFKIPRGGNYPPLNGIVPQWWNAAATAGGIDQFLDQYDVAQTNKEIRFRDPRWAGAFKKTFGMGTNSEVDFRALCFNHGGGTTSTPNAGKYLYLSWYVKVHPTIGSAYDGSFVDVGFRPTSGTPMRYRIILQAGANTGTPPNAGTFGPGFGVTVFQHSSGTTWTTLGGGSVPTWLSAEGHIWTKPPGGTPWWAVQMRVPLSPLAGGLDLSGKFGLGFYVEADTTSFVIDHRWPSGLPALESGDPNPSSFQDCFLEVGSGLPMGDTELRAGVSLAQTDIGTIGVTATFTGSGGPYTITSPQAIKYTAGSTSQFFAAPKNEDPSNNVPADDIHARFVLANFGSMPPGGPWKTLGSGLTHPQIAMNGGQQNITFDWTPNMTDEAYYTANPHQCIMVDLSTADPNLTFLNSSAARNMDFGAASKFTREVEISVEGVKDGYPYPNRDVYVYVERINVPVRIDDETRRKYAEARRLLESLKGGDGDNNFAVATHLRGFPTSQQLETIVPTVKYYVYRDTGRISMRKGVARPVLEVQPSFGYHLWIDHDVDSWELRLQGAEKLGENLYLLRPPTEGSMKVTTSIHAVQQGEEIEPPEKIVPFPRRIPPDQREGCLIQLKKMLHLG